MFTRPHTDEEREKMSEGILQHYRDNPWRRELQRANTLAYWRRQPTFIRIVHRRLPRIPKEIHA